ncbi:MAG: transposase [Solobacterium sp.]|jgi:hypothetical protein|nr:transposase [Solobacterium sp.]MCH4013353.1 transposase [Solobacterium sp.]MCH4013395.1 transposase [Solobacterium sp.]MCH4013575.1 transposase [Solobacterium sp.]MCH4014296.1 transposase [Solobacterium sp.]
MYFIDEDRELLKKTPDRCRPSFSSGENALYIPLDCYADLLKKYLLKTDLKKDFENTRYIIMHFDESVRDVCHKTAPHAIICVLPYTVDNFIISSIVKYCRFLEEKYSDQPDSEQYLLIHEHWKLLLSRLNGQNLPRWTTYRGEIVNLLWLRSRIFEFYPVTEQLYYAKSTFESLCREPYFRTSAEYCMEDMINTLFNCTSHDISELPLTMENWEDEILNGIAFQQFEDGYNRL